MKSTRIWPVVNGLISFLPPREYKRFVQNCERVDLVVGTVLCEPGEDFHFVYFPLKGFVSLTMEVGAHPSLEMGMIGSEGMLGGTLALGIDAAPLRGIVKGAGSALRMTISQLKDELNDSPTLARLLRRYLFVLMAQLSQTAACNSFHEVEKRLARWLLMSHDRSHADHFHLTHQTLADMLGVQRSAITIAAGMLRDKKLIQYARGNIQILDRCGLEAASCECYAAAMGDFEQQPATH